MTELWEDGGVVEARVLSIDFELSQPRTLSQCLQDRGSQRTVSRPCTRSEIDAVSEPS